MRSTARRTPGWSAAGRDLAERGEDLLRFGVPALDFHEVSVGGGGLLGVREPRVPVEGRHGPPETSEASKTLGGRPRALGSLALPQVSSTCAVIRRARDRAGFSGAGVAQSRPQAHIA